MLRSWGWSPREWGFCLIKETTQCSLASSAVWGLGEKIYQFSSVTPSCPTLYDPMNCSMPGFPVHHHLPKLAHMHVHCVGEAIQPSHPLLSPSPIFNLLSIRVFSNESVLHIRWPKYWSLSFSISPSDEHSGLKRYIDICKPRSPNSGSAGISILDFPGFRTIRIYVCYLWAA